MPPHLRPRIPVISKPINPSQFHTYLNPLFINPKPSKLPQTKTRILRMVTESNNPPPPTKRPTCPKCSKPARVCLCNRFRTPALHNSVKVTILQHILEKNHPLNSTRIANMGLKNVDIVTVSDVKFKARFVFSLLESSRHVFDKMPSRKKAGFVELDDEGSEDASNADVDFTIEKNGGISSYNGCLMPRSELEEISFDQLLIADNVGVDEIRRKGFVVKKYRRKGSEEGSDEKEECEEIEEFEIVVQPGSVLLFPSEESVGVDAVDFEVKNLIALDGTWPKAKRMYSENPWLRLLPHVRLDIDKLSLYSEVRRQPRAGYLSSIESIVYALKAVGEEESEGLDGLLDVFESMVGDQRRCMNERLSKEASETEI